MEIFALLVIALLVGFLALVVHAWCGNGTPVAGARIEVAAGCVLIGLGVKVLLEHLGIWPC